MSWLFVTSGIPWWGVRMKMLEATEFAAFRVVPTNSRDAPALNKFVWPSAKRGSKKAQSMMQPQLQKKEIKGKEKRKKKKAKGKRQKRKKHNLKHTTAKDIPCSNRICKLHEKPQTPSPPASSSVHPTTEFLMLQTTSSRSPTLTTCMDSSRTSNCNRHR